MLPTWHIPPKDQNVDLSSIDDNMGSKSDPSSDGLPSYSESVHSPQQDSSPTYLPQIIAAARTVRISSLLITCIIPHLHEIALSGLSSTTLILVPSDVSSLRPPSKIGSESPSDSKNETIVGFPSPENLTMVRLYGQENSLDFWRQMTVMQELGQQMRTHLRNSGHRVIDYNETNHRKPKSPIADWRTVQKKSLGNGEVEVGIETREICLRTENDMGLYETRTGKAVVLKVDCGD